MLEVAEHEQLSHCWVSEEAKEGPGGRSAGYMLLPAVLREEPPVPSRAVVPSKYQREYPRCGFHSPNLVTVNAKGKEKWSGICAISVDILLRPGDWPCSNINLYPTSPDRRELKEKM